MKSKSFLQILLLIICIISGSIAIYLKLLYEYKPYNYFLFIFIILIGIGYFDYKIKGVILWCSSILVFAITAYFPIRLFIKLGLNIGEIGVSILLFFCFGVVVIWYILIKNLLKIPETILEKILGLIAEGI